MKTIGYHSTLLIVMFILSLVMGCGRGEDETKKVVPESGAPQTVVEKKTVLPAENNAAASQKTENTQVTETQQIVQAIMDVIVIENQGYVTDKKGPVKFSHLKHNKEYEVSCVQCHHVYVDGKNLWKEGDRVDKCIVCHDPVEDKDKAVKLQSAFHKNCRDCHTEASKEGKESPDKKCSECHGN